MDVPDTRAKRIPGKPAPTSRTVKRTIGPCDGCRMHREYGCGWVGAKSMATFKHTEDGSMPDVARTCPEFYACQHSVSECYEHLADFKAGRLGNVQHLPAPLHSGLLLLEGEHGALEAKLSE